MGTTSAKSKPWVQAQAQRWASTRQSRGHGHRFNSVSPGRGASDRAGAGADAGAQPGKAPGCGPACAWSWHWCSPGSALAVGAGDRAGAGAALGFNQAKPWPPIQPGKAPGMPMLQPATPLPKIVRKSLSIGMFDFLRVNPCFLR